MSNTLNPDILSSLIWVQTANKGYQQTTLVGKELNDTTDLEYFILCIKGTQVI